jgi:hypothetical protein
VKLALNEIIKKDDFKYERAPKIYAVIVNLNNRYGYALISSEGKTEMIKTGRKETSFRIIDITNNQSCMLYG